MSYPSSYRQGKYFTPIIGLIIIIVLVVELLVAIIAFGVELLQSAFSR
jgi:hypothetical protein